MRLRDLREDHDMTQTALADLLSFSELSSKRSYREEAYCR